MNINGDDKPENQDELFKSLFRNVPVRPRPPDEVEKAAFKHFREDWEALNPRRKRRTRVVYWAMAASILLALLIQPVVFHFGEKSGAAFAIGKVEKFRGDVAVFADGKRTDLEAGGPPVELFSKQSLRTGNGAGLSVKWGGHKTVRVDQNTRLNLLSGNEIELVTGQIYVDAPPKSGSSSLDGNLSILTRFGTISHKGTQFMVSADDEAVEVRVREGTVTLDSGPQHVISQQGEQTVFHAPGEMSSSAIAVYGHGWQWVEKLSPGFALEGSTLADFLGWVRRETGKQLVYETDAAHYSADSTILHGNVDLEPMLSLDLVLQTTEMTWYEKDGTIHLSVDH